MFTGSRLQSTKRTASLSKGLCPTMSRMLILVPWWLLRVVCRDWIGGGRGGRSDEALACGGRGGMVLVPPPTVRLLQSVCEEKARHKTQSARTAKT